MYQQYGHSQTLDASYKVLVLGDSGVGKSSLVHMLCHDEPPRNQMPTVGCNIDVRLHSSTIPSTAAGTSAASFMTRSISEIPSLVSRADPTTSAYSTGSGVVGSTEPTFIEFYDVSGSPAVRHAKSRSMFYSGTTYHGLILVHDLCNRRSYDNLWKWVGDYVEASSFTSGSSTAGYQYGGQHGQLHIPVLIVGTKNDMASAASSSSFSTGTGTGTRSHLDLAEKYGAEAISVSAISPADFMPNSSTSIAFNMFFGRVMDPNSNGFSRSRTPSNQSGVFATGVNSGSLSGSGVMSTTTPGFPRQPPTPTPGQHQPARERSPYQDRAYSDDVGSGSPAIPIMDFATFTGGAASASDTMSTRSSVDTPIRSGSPLARPITPTGTSTGTALSTKSALRTQYERNRSVLNQYSNLSVPVYTSHINNGSNSSSSRSTPR